MSKRRRTENFTVKRPIDKRLIVIGKTGVDATQVSTLLSTAAFPCTITGLRWDLTVRQDAGTVAAGYAWAIVVVRETVTADLMTLTDAATFFAPEENVLAFGIGDVVITSESRQWVGSTKTMRKLQTGDSLKWIGVGGTTNTTAFRGCIQFFCMT